MRFTSLDGERIRAGLAVFIRTFDTRYESGSVTCTRVLARFMASGRRQEASADPKSDKLCSVRPCVRLLGDVWTARTDNIPAAVLFCAGNAATAAE